VTDQAVIRQAFDYGDLAVIRQAGRRGGPEAGFMATILRGVVSWNLVLPDGKPRPLSNVDVARLDEPTVMRLVADEHLGAAFPEESPPNASGDPSPDGSPQDDTRTPTPPEPQPLTTS
jgi:hypothetical protein